MGFFESIFEGCDKIVVLLAALGLLILGGVLGLVAGVIGSLFGFPFWVAFGVVLLVHIFWAVQLLYVEDFFG